MYTGDVMGSGKLSQNFGDAKFDEEEEKYILSRGLTAWSMWSWIPDKTKNQ